MFMRDYLPRATAFPKARELCERIKAEGLRIALASSAKEEEIEAHKRTLGIGDLLDESTSAADAEKTKPYPDIFQAALGRLGNVTPVEAIVVGDSPYDAQAAAKAGIKTIGVLSGGFPEEVLHANGVIAVYRDVAD